MEDEQIRSLVEREVELLERLNYLSQLKREALMQKNIKSLEEISLKEETLVQDLEKIDDTCSPQVRFFLEENKFADLSEKLRILLTKLRESAIQYKASNEFNQELLQDAISLTKFTVNMFTSSFKNTNFHYGPIGKVVNAVNNATTNHLLDFKG